eukprot:2011224-Rhodomonas_salina.1
MATFFTGCNGHPRHKASASVLSLPPSCLRAQTSALCLRTLTPRFASASASTLCLSCRRRWCYRNS